METEKQKRIKKGGRKPGTPNKLTSARLLQNYITDYLEERRTYEKIKDTPEKITAFALCVLALEKIKENKTAAAVISEQLTDN